MQTIRLGLALDGQPLGPAAPAADPSPLGPQALLTMLETALGLLRLPVPHVLRVLQMRHCLQQARNGQRFYERSLDSDEVGTAACLLDWRDQWHAQGWTGQMLPSASARLIDMAAVELLARDAVAEGVGQRLARVALALATRRPPIAQLQLLDPLPDWPLAWRRVLALLPCADASGLQACAAPGSLLGDLQLALLTTQVGGQPVPLPWRDDGSLRVVRGESRLAAAQWLARQLAPDDRGHSVVVPTAGILLDAALAAADRPRLGLTPASPCRPVLQLLPLALRLLWAPLDCQALLAFLTLPVHPLPEAARRRLAARLVETPGTGGQAWRDLVAALADDIPAADAPAEGMVAAIAFWISPPRHRPADLLPLALVDERVARLVDFFDDGLRAAGQDLARLAAWQAGLDQTHAMRQALQVLLKHGQQRIAPGPLAQLVALSTAHGAAHPLLQAQAGAQACVTDPAALTEPVDQVSWWPMAAPALPVPPPWSRQELASLRAAGVDLADPAALLAQQARASLRAVLLARRRLTLLLPCPGQDPHPRWLAVQGLFDGLPVQACEQVLHSAPVDGLSAALAWRPLPARQRWWRLPAGTPLAWPAEASYTSLELLLFNPFHWLLAYPARLRPSALLRLPDEFRLLGQLAHRLVEQLYRTPGSAGWTPGQVGAWLDEWLDTLVDEEAALLRMPGRRAELASFQLRLRAALLQLHGHLQRAGMVLVEPEKRLAAATAIGPLRGSCDLLLTRADGRQGVLDLKWSGLAKYRDKLQQQSFLQLSVYAQLQQQRSGAWPAVGYFVLREGELLTPARDLFPGLRPVPLPDDACAQVWQRAVATWRWRKAQIDAGEVELVLDDLAATEDSIAPSDALAIETLAPQYNPFVHLAGWERA